VSTGERIASEAPRLRRAPTLLCYWENGDLVAHNFVSGKRAAVGEQLCGILDFFGSERTERQLLQAYAGVPPPLLRRAVRRLQELTFLQPDGADDASAGWKGWNPSAGFFHFTTRDLNYAADDAGDLDSRSMKGAPPAPVKSYARASRVQLPPAAENDAFSQVLLQRRTWRQFGAEPVSLAQLATLLRLTFGVQWWVDLGARGKAALKTYPSGGARHSLESYVVARRVEGLAAGTYHYQPEQHALELLSARASRRQIVRYLGGQSCYGSAGAVVLMTSAFGRVQWRYPNARAYRVVLAEAGHACQNFCLVATWLGLAPFCTMALADSRIERDLGLDPWRESVLYAAGVGTRPEGSDWAPLPPEDQAAKRSGRRAQAKLKRLPPFPASTRR
jgi:SagB-type dehydrogenase family enzyme